LVPDPSSISGIESTEEWPLLEGQSEMAGCGGSRRLIPSLLVLRRRPCIFYCKRPSSFIGTMTSSGEIREVLRKCLPEIREKYGVTSIGIFGSYARGEADPSSDIDVIVEFDRPIGWELVDLADFLESRLHHKVDLVIRRSLHPLIRDTILAEVQYA
jgi:predicted nucleotidyltransferase